MKIEENLTENQSTIAKVELNEPRPPETPMLFKNPCMKAVKSSSSLISSNTNRNDTPVVSRRLMMKASYSDNSLQSESSGSAETLNRKSLKCNQELLDYHLQTAKNESERLYAQFTKLLGENEALEGLVAKKLLK